VLDPGGALLAGPDALGEAARDLLGAAGNAEEIHVTTPDGAVFAARSDAHTRVVLTDKGGQPRTLGADDPATEPLLDAAERLISAAHRGSRG
jgi:hypothetical protein